MTWQAVFGGVVASWAAGVVQPGLLEAIGTQPWRVVVWSHGVDGVGVSVGAVWFRGGARVGVSGGAGLFGGAGVRGFPLGALLLR